MIRVYTWSDRQGNMLAMMDACLSAYAKWGDLVRAGVEDGLYGVWLEFDTEEDAALFKLMEM